MQGSFSEAKQQVGHEDFISSDVAIIEFNGILNAALKKGLAPADVLQVLLQFLNTSTRHIDSVKSLNELFIYFMNNFELHEFIKKSPTNIANIYANLAGIFLHAGKNYFLRFANNNQTLSQSKSNSKQFDAQDLEALNILLASLDELITQEDSNRQLYELFYQTIREFHDANFMTTWNSFSQHEYENFSVTLLLQNISSHVENSNDAVSVLRYFLIAATYYILNHPEENITSELKYHAYGQSMRCIKQATSIKELQRIKEYLLLDAFNFLRRQSNPYIEAAQNAITQKERLHDVWQEILAEYEHRINSLSTTLSS